MLNDRDKNVILKIIGAAVVVFIIVWYFGHDDGEKTGPNDPDIQTKSLYKIISNVNVIGVNHSKGTVIVAPGDADILPDISKYPPQVNGSTSYCIEIFSSPEKAGSGTNGWLAEAARDFNNAAIMIDGKKASVTLRSIASGQGADYIISDNYLPDAYTPSNELWGEMIASHGKKAQLVQERLVGNVAGILITKAKKEELTAKYGAVNIKTIIDAVANNEMQMGYTDPLTSSTGLNFLISALQTFNSSNLFSDSALAGFKSFQANIPVIALTTQQLKDDAKSCDLDGLILEYQTYINDPEMRSYEFIPFGIRHDSPMYAIGELSAEKMKILNKFVEFSQQEKYQKLATEYGFNGLNEYQSNASAVSGDVIIRAEKVWKDIKDPMPICAVFVADVSESMDGEPLNNLKRSLLLGQNKIGKNNMIGLVSFSNDVYIDLPISKFDLNNMSYFVGAVRDWQPISSTSTYDAIAVAMKMLIDQKAAGPNANPHLKPRIILLSDGEQNTGHSLEDIIGIKQELGVPITVIGYNANIPKLKEISKPEGSCIDADSEDVIYKMNQLFTTVL